MKLSEVTFEELLFGGSEFIVCATNIEETNELEYMYKSLVPGGCLIRSGTICERRFKHGLNVGWSLGYDFGYWGMIPKYFWEDIGSAEVIVDVTVDNIEELI